MAQNRELSEFSRQITVSQSPNTVVFSSNVITVNASIVANGSAGTSGQVLTSSAGGNVYWSTVSGGGGSGTVTSISTANGIAGGPITTSGSIYAVGNTGIVANTSGLFVNSTYIGTLSANNTTYVNNKTEGNLNVNSALNSINSNNSTYLNSVAAANYLQTTGTYAISGIRNHTANVSVSAAIIANGSAGTSGQVLTSSAGGNVYWSSKDYISVKDFGAVGDGTTNDTTAIQNAVTASIGKTLLFPKGTYLITTTILLSSTSGGYLLFEEGAKLLVSPAFVFGSGNYYSAAINITGNNWTVDGAEISGNKNTKTTGVYCDGIDVQGKYNTITNCLIQYTAAGINFRNDVGGVAAVPSEANKALNNRINDTLEMGISNYLSKDCIVSGNIITNTGFEGITLDVYTRNARVTNNIIKGSNVLGGVGGMGIDACYYCIISGNYIEGSIGRPGIGSENNVDDTFQNIICNNNFVNNGGGGIWLKYKAMIPMYLPRSVGDTTRAQYRENQPGYNYFLPYTAGKLYGSTNWNTITGNQFFGNGGSPTYGVTAALRIDSNCTGNALNGNVYNGAMPDVDAAAVSTRVDNGLVSFHAYNTIVRSNVTGTGTSYTIPFNVIVTNTGSGYNSTTGVFTAPVGGVYQLNASVRILGATATGTHWLSCGIVAGSYNFVNTLDYGSSTYSPTYQTLQSSGVVTLKKGQTASVIVRVGGEASNVVDVENDAAACYFTGVLIG